MVYYDPLNPEKNALSEFGELSASSVGPVPAMLFGIGAVAFYIQIQRRRNPKNATQTASRFLS